MSAELLREAAKVLREHAINTLPGDWVAEVRNDNACWVSVPTESHAWGMHGWPGETRYVALMHPPVALALAAWLESAADALSANYDGEWSLLDEIGDDFTAQGAIATARAILRRSE